jgi:hypothetical protein
MVQSHFKQKEFWRHDCQEEERRHDITSGEAEASASKNNPIGVHLSPAYGG